MKVTIARTAGRNVMWTIVGVGSGLVIVWPVSAVSPAAPLVAATVATSCYVAAAAFGARWVGWAGVPVVVGASTAGDLVGARPGWLPVAALVGLLVGVGLVHHQRATLVQSGAMLSFLGAAGSSIYLEPRAGLALAGIILASHAAWDVLHYRRDAVVPRSFAVWCIALDLTAGGVCLWAALMG